MSLQDDLKHDMATGRYRISKMYNPDKARREHKDKMYELPPDLVHNELKDIEGIDFTNIDENGQEHTGSDKDNAKGTKRFERRR